jgi:hypothetical protein
MQKFAQKIFAQCRETPTTLPQESIIFNVRVGMKFVTGEVYPTRQSITPDFSRQQAAIASTI